MDRVRSSAMGFVTFRNLRGAGNPLRRPRWGAPSPDKRGSVPWRCPAGQRPALRKCPIGKEFFAAGSGGSDREALSAAALALDVRIAEAKGFVEPLFHE